MSTVRPSHLVVTVHGIRTYGHWQERLEGLVTAQPSDHEVEFANYKFGFFSALSFAVPFLRWLLVRKFKRELIRLCTVKDRARIDLVGHSFGTHVIAWAIADLAADTRIRFHTVILSGSVLRAAFPWHQYVGTRVGRVVNDCGSRDGILLLSQFLVFFTGMAGRTGFSGSTGATFRNRYSTFGHSGYFQDALGKPSDSYMHQHWVPLLTSDKPAPAFDNRAPPTTLDKFLEGVATHAGLIKLVAYLSPVVILLVIYFTLYNRAEEQRKAALTTESRLLSGLSKEAVRNKRAHIGTMLALAALPDTERGSDRPYLAAAEQALYRALRDDRSVAGLGGDCGFDADVSRAVCAFFQKSAQLVEVPSGRSIRQLGELIPSSFKFSADATRLVTIHHENDSTVVRLWNARDGAPIADLGRGNNPIFSPVDPLLVVPRPNERLDVWDANAGKLLHSLAGEGFPRFSNGGKYLIVTSGDSASIIEARTGRRALELRQWKDRGVFEGIVFSADESLLAVQLAIEVAVFDLSTGAELLRLSVRGPSVAGLELSRDGKRLLLAPSESSAELWDIGTKSKIASLGAETGRISGLKLSPDGTRIAAAFNDEDRKTFFAKLWDGLTGREVATLQGHTRTVTLVEFSSDAATFVTVSDYDYGLKLWNAATGRLIADLRGHTAPVERIVFSPDSKTFLSVARAETFVPFDYTARLWDAETGRLLAVLDHAGPEWEAGFSRDGKRIFTDSLVWSNNTGGPLEVTSIALEGTKGRAAVSPQGTHLAVAASNEVGIWDTANGARTSALRGHEAAITHLAFDLQGGMLATASDDTTARIWSVRSKTVQHVLRGHAKPVRKAYFNRSGTRLVTESMDETARVWDVRTGAVLAVVKGLAGEIARTEVSDDGRFIVAVAGPLGESTARLFDAATGSQLAELGRAEGVVFNPSASRLVTACAGCESRLWDLPARKPLRSLGPMREHGAIFSADGKRLVTYDGLTMTLHDGETGREIKELDGFPFGAAARFSADSSRILVWASGQATSQNLVRIYDARHGELLVPKDMREIAQPNIAGAAFSSDEKKIVTIHNGGVVRLLDAATLDVLGEFGEPSAAGVDALLSRDGTRLIVVHSDSSASDRKVIVWRIFPTVQALVSYAKAFPPGCQSKTVGKGPQQGGLTRTWCSHERWGAQVSAPLAGDE